VVAFKDEKRTVQLSLRQADILQALATDAELMKQGGCVPDLQKIDKYTHSHPFSFSLSNEPRRGPSLPVFHPEFGRFMLESTPGKPWGIGFRDLLDVEPNMRWRLVRPLSLLDFG
jgi:glutamate--cysteine ligase catalytic subunit